MRPTQVDPVAATVGIQRCFFEAGKPFLRPLDAMNNSQEPLLAFQKSPRAHRVIFLAESPPATSALA